MSGQYFNYATITPFRTLSQSTITMPLNVTKHIYCAIFWQKSVSIRAFANPDELESQAIVISHRSNHLQPVPLRLKMELTKQQRQAAKITLGINNRRKVFIEHGCLRHKQLLYGSSQFSFRPVHFRPTTRCIIQSHERHLVNGQWTLKPRQRFNRNLKPQLQTLGISDCFVWVAPGKCRSNAFNTGHSIFQNYFPG